MTTQTTPPATAEEEDSPLLVSEFPPPPFYYRHHGSSLTPPEIPVRALEMAAQRVAAIAAAAREGAERNRLEASNPTNDEKASPHATLSSEEEEDGTKNVVAVFGEIVEDPLLVRVEDECADPTIVREEVGRLNKRVLQGFVTLVSELVHRPLGNKKFRDELSHNIFLMLQECNKFREHQAREILIDMLEKQWNERKAALEDLRDEIGNAEDALRRLKLLDDSS